MKTLIKNAILLDMVSKECNIKNADILINDNIIQKISENIEEQCDKTIDATGMVCMPGLVNTHTHLGMSIFKGYKDDNKLMDWLNNVIWPIEDKFTENEIYWNSYMSSIEMIKSGTTTFNDMYFNMEKVIEVAEETGQRAVISWSVTDNSIRDKFEKTREYFNKYNHKNSLIKIYVSAHAGYTCNPETIEKCVKLAKELGTGIHIHLAETKAEEQIIKENYGKTPTKYLKDLGVFEVPVILAHGIYFSKEDIEILKTIKGGISHNPISNCKLASGICDVTNLKNNGITVALGTDGAGSTTTLDMFEEMRVTGYLQKVSKLDSTCIKAYDILKMATIEGAKILGLENEIGTIEEGKKADIILINIDKTHLYPINDIYSNLVYSATGQDVDTVIIDGKIIMENRKLQNIDEQKVRKEIQKIQEQLMQ